MARIWTERIVKRNTKLETFLKKNLDVDTYEKIRAYDSCIVCSEKEDKAFKYIVLSDDWIYLTENPPKKIYETVHLKDLVSVELVNDYPSFLQGEEQQNAQHLVIRYLSDVSVKAKKRRSAQKGKNSASDSYRADLMPSSARGPPKNPIIRPYSSGSLSARETKEMKVITAQQLLAELERSRLDSTVGRQVQFSKSSPAVFAYSTQDPMSEGPDPEEQALALPSGGVQSAKKKAGKKKKKRESDPPPCNGTGSRLTPRISGELKLDLSKLGTYDDEDETQEENTEGADLNKKPKTTTAKSDHFQQVMTTDCEQQNDAREVTMHVYIMDGRSKILMLIQSARHNYLLRGTLENDPKYVLNTTVITPKSAQATSEKLEFLFRQLKTELQYSTNTMIDNFIHIHELKVATERNFALRKLFWKTPDVFSFMVNQLTNYMQMNQTNLNKCKNEDDFKLVRADELEYLVLILETLSVVFRETEIVPTRIEMMKLEAGRITKQLISSLVTCPEVPQSSQTVSQDHTLQHTAELELTETGIDFEIFNLLKEYRNLSTAVLFELLIIGDQAAWCDRESTLLNSSWILKHLGDKKQVESFLEHIIKEAIGMLSSQLRDSVTPSKAVLLYQQFHILKSITYFNAEFTSFIRENFFEEFKYYIQVPILDVKLPSSYPLRPNILKLVESVVSEVLQKSVRLF